MSENSPLVPIGLAGLSQEETGPKSHLDNIITILEKAGVYPSEDSEGGLWGHEEQWKEAHQKIDEYIKNVKP